MAGITNLFKPIESKTGTFFTFSEVSKQLTKALSNPQITIMPSKFVCLNLPDFYIPGVSNVMDANGYIPTMLQNYFENKITYLQQASGKDETNNSDYIFSLKDIERSFWATIKKIYPEKFEVNFDAEGNNNLKYLQEKSNIITYIGDINIQNYEEYDNMGYSEIFVHIPFDARPIKNVLFDANDREFSEILYKNSYEYEYKNSILGYPESLPNIFDGKMTNIGIFDKNAPIVDDSKGTETYPEYYIGYNARKEISHYMGLTLQTNDNYISRDVETPPYEIDTEKTSIDFNAILVYFRVVSNNGLTDDLTRDDGIDIPYGLYIISDLNQELTPKGWYCNFNKTEHKYVNINKTENNSVYNEQSGSGYALRIATRYLSVPSGTVYPVVEFVGSGDNSEKVSIYSELLGYMQKSQDLMMRSTDYMANIRNEVQQIYEGVKWNQFNVPQIYKKGNNYWWYINFKNTGHRASGLSAYEVYLSTLPKDENGNPINPLGVEEWLDSLSSRTTYKRVIYTNKNVDESFGEMYPELYKLDSNMEPVYGEYADGLKELIEAKNLTPGILYEIVDFKTTQTLNLVQGTSQEKVNIPYMPIVVQAVSTSELSPEGFISAAPEWRIYYDYSNISDKYAWTPSGHINNKGTIYGLYNKKYDVSFPYDIFNIYFADKEGNFVRTFKNNSSFDSETAYYGWPSNLTGIHIEPAFDGSKRHLNNIVIDFAGPSDATINSFHLSGRAQTVSYIKYNFPLYNIRINEFDMPGCTLNLGGQKPIYNLNIKGPLKNTKDEIFDRIDFRDLKDPYFENLNIMADENICKEVSMGYYYSPDDAKTHIRPVLTYISGDGVLQSVIPTYILK